MDATGSCSDATF